MELLTEENWDAEIEPAAFDAILADVQPVADALLRGQQDVASIPVWYVLTKAAGASGIALDVLYRDPLSRKHALGVLAVETRVAEALRRAATEE